MCWYLIIFLSTTGLRAIPTPGCAQRFCAAGIILGFVVLGICGWLHTRPYLLHYLLGHIGCFTAAAVQWAPYVPYWSQSP